MPRSLSTDYREISVDLPEEKYHAMPKSLSAEDVDKEEESETDENYHLPRSVSMQYSVDENHNKDYHGNKEPIGKHGKHEDLSPYVIGQSRNGNCMVYDHSNYNIKFRNSLTQSNQSSMSFSALCGPMNMGTTESMDVYYRRTLHEIPSN